MLEAKDQNKGNLLAHTAIFPYSCSQTLVVRKSFPCIPAQKFQQDFENIFDFDVTLSELGVACKNPDVNNRESDCNLKLKKLCLYFRAPSYIIRTCCIIKV